MFSDGIHNVKCWFEAGMFLRLENSIFTEGGEWFHGSAAAHPCGIAVLLLCHMMSATLAFVFFILLTCSVNIVLSQLPTITEVYQLVKK